MICQEVRLTVMEDRMIGTYGGSVVTSGNELVGINDVVEASGAAVAPHRAALMGRPVTQCWGCFEA